MGRINIEVSDDTHSELKVQAARKGVTLKEHVTDVLDNQAESGIEA